MIIKGVVLFRIKCLQERGRRITPEVSAHLVHFIQEEHRIRCPCAPDALNDLSWHCTNVCTPVSLYLCFVPNSTQRDPYKFSRYCPGNGLTQRCLAYPRWTDQAQDGASRGTHHLLNSEVFQNTFLHLVQAIVVFIQNLLCKCDILLILAHLIPWQHEKPINIISYYRCLGAHGRHHA